MNELNRHDQYIKKALESIEEPYDGVTWTNLETRLNSRFTEEHPPAVEAVDKALYSKLDQLQPSFSQGHWEILAKELRAIAQLRRNILSAKVLELCLFALFIGSVGFWLPSSNPTAISAPVAEVPISENKPESLQNAPVTSHSGANNSGISQAKEQVRSEKVAIVESKRPINRAQGGVVGRQSILAGLDSEQSMISIPVQSHLVEQSAPNQPAIEKMEQAVEQESAPINNLDALPVLKISSLPELGTNSMVVKNLLPFQSPRRIFIGAYSGIDFMRIQTPRDDIYNKSGYVQYGVGYDFGLYAAWRRGNWGIETGMGYYSKSFKPKPDLEIFGGSLDQGYLSSRLYKVDLDVISLPIRLTYRLGNFRKTALLAVAGVSYHLALQADFLYNTSRYTGGAPANEGNVNKDPVLNSSPKYRVAGNGVLDGGEFRENSQVMTEAGIRMEHAFWPRFAAFVEPTLNYSISNKGIGPKQNKLGSLSLKFGVLTNL